MPNGTRRGRKRRGIVHLPGRVLPCAPLPRLVPLRLSAATTSPRSFIDSGSRARQRLNAGGQSTILLPFENPYVAEDANKRVQAVGHSAWMFSQLVPHFGGRDDPLVAESESQPLDLAIEAHECHLDVLSEDQIRKQVAEKVN